MSTLICRENGFDLSFFPSNIRRAKSLGQAMAAPGPARPAALTSPRLFAKIDSHSAA